MERINAEVLLQYQSSEAIEKLQKNWGIRRQESVTLLEIWKSRLVFVCLYENMAV